MFNATHVAGKYTDSRFFGLLIVAAAYRRHVDYPQLSLSWYT